MPSRRSFIPWSFLTSKRLQARVLSTVLCATLVVLLPFSRLGGRAAFLALTIKELVFSAQESLSQQIEATVLHLLGGLVGIVLSCFANYVAFLAHRRTGNDTLTRCIPALFLSFICFTAGWLKSRLPRLTFTSRIACFVSIWLLTWDVGSTKFIPLHCANLVWIVLTAALTSLLSSMLLLQWSSTQFAHEVAKAFSDLYTCLDYAVKAENGDIPSGQQHHACYILPAELLKRSVSLDALYQQASFELRVGRVSVKSLKPLITVLEHLRRILSRRTSLPQTTSTDDPEEVSVINAFHDPASDLGAAILDSMKFVEHEVLFCYNGVSPPEYEPSAHQTTANPAVLQMRLSRTVNIAREHLQEICDDIDAQKRVSSGDVELLPKVFDSCAYMIDLLQMAQEMQLSLRVAQEIRGCYNLSKPRLWYPRFSLAWLGVTPNTVSADEGGTFLDSGNPDETTITALSEREALQGIAESTQIAEREDDYIKTITKKSRTVGRPFSFRWLRSLIRFAWNHRKVLKSRLRLSRLLKAVEHSPHLRHAFKNGLGVALLSIPAYSPSHKAREWFLSSYGQWMIISYVWVLETNTGATCRVAYLRLCGTISGALYAYIASLITGTNPYALVTMTALAELPISWVIISTKIAPLGTVAAVTIPPVLFSPYFHANAGFQTWELALLRGAMISIGIVSALFMNAMLFPRHCRVLFLDYVCRTIGLTSQLFMNMCRDSFHYSTSLTAINNKRNYKLERDIRNALHRLSILLNTMNDEISLVPKPMRRYRKILDTLHQLSYVLTGLRKSNQNIIRRDIMATIAPQRRELISCICISLFASEQVFRARQALPQFLPSSRVAYLTLEREVEEQILQSEQGEHESLGLSLIYMFAEMDLLAELVDTIDELLELTRQLFGTSSWLSQTPMQSTMLMSTAHEEVGAGSTILTLA